MLNLPELLIIVGTALTTGLVVLATLGNRRRPVPAPAEIGPEPMALIFEDGILHHASPSALGHLGFLPGAHDWHHLRDKLSERFRDFPDVAGGSVSGSLVMAAADGTDPGLCRIEWKENLCWVEITCADTARQNEDAVALTGPDRIAAQLCDALTHPAWEVDATGRITWRNAACAALLAGIEPDDAQKTRFLRDSSDRARVALNMADGAQRWFTVVRQTGGETTLCHATDVTALVESERAQATFVQTLAKTFAHLSIGLAIFDRDGRLSIFNPALVDLTRLKPSFLAGQPPMMSFFDALRENRAMPEPKDYRSWRQEIAALIAAASDGQYRETWTLEDGRTFCVQGRPHPDGATAFMIEDISPEITLTRNFRIEVEQYEALLDTARDALVVFSRTGVLTYCNAAYREMWGHNPEAAFADVTILDALDLWQAEAGADDAWGDIADYVSTLGQRAPVAIALPRDGDAAAIRCELSPASTNATLVRFLAAPASAPAGQKQADPATP